MPQTTTFDESPKVSARAPMPRTWAGKMVKPTERATHYLHLSAVPCEKCKGPVLSGWIGRRADDITRETQVHTVGAICLSCGARPDAQANPARPTHPTHLRPFEWEWIAEAPPPSTEFDGDPLSAELAQDADTAINSSASEKGASL
jgi:hypothetical protein